VKFGIVAVVTPPVVETALPVEVNAAVPLQFVSFGPKTVKSTVPVGATPDPVKVAVSWKDPPSTTGVGATAVVTVGVPGLIVSVSPAVPHVVINGE
jgi:hypothetical protein